MKHTAVIMVGGKGTRLRPFTHVLPKPLLPMGKTTVIEQIIAGLHKHGIRDIVLLTNYKEHLFRYYLGTGARLGIRLRYLKEQKPLGTAGGLSLLNPRPTVPFLLMNGDVLTRLNFRKVLEYHTRQKADLTIVTKKMFVPFAYGVVHAHRGRVTKMQEKPSLEMEINSGVYVVSPSVLRLIPKNRPALMTDVVQKALHSPALQVFRFVNTTLWHDIGQLEDYEKARQTYGHRSAG